MSATMTHRVYNSKSNAHKYDPYSVITISVVFHHDDYDVYWDV